MASYVGSGTTLNTTSQKSSFTTGTDGGSNYTVGSGSDRLLLIWLIGYTVNAADTKGATAVTHNGQSATSVGFTPTNGRGWVECWRIINPTTGAGGTSVTCPGDQRAFIAFVEEWTGVDQTTPIHATFDTYGSNSGTSKTFALTTHAANSGLSAAVAVQSAAGTWSASDGGTLRQSGQTGTTGFNDVSGGLASEEVASAGSNSLTISWTNSNNNSGAMVEVLAAAGGGSTGSASGSASASGTGASVAAATASATGTSVASGVSGGATSATATASGTATATGAGASVSAATASASGSATASATGQTVIAGAGTATGAATASATGAASIASVGAASGSAIVVAGGAAQAAAAFAASGVATVTGYSVDLSSRRTASPGGSATGGTFTRSGKGGTIARTFNSGTII